VLRIFHFLPAETVRSITRSPLPPETKILDYFSMLANGIDAWTVALATVVGLVILLACLCIQQRRVIYCKSAVVHKIWNSILHVILKSWLYIIYNVSHHSVSVAFLRGRTKIQVSIHSHNSTMPIWFILFMILFIKSPAARKAETLGIYSQVSY